MQEAVIVMQYARAPLKIGNGNSTCIPVLCIGGNSAAGAHCFGSILSEVESLSGWVYFLQVIRQRSETMAL